MYTEVFGTGDDKTQLQGAAFSVWVTPFREQDQVLLGGESLWMDLF